MSGWQIEGIHVAHVAGVTKKELMNRFSCPSELYQNGLASHEDYP